MTDDKLEAAIARGARAKELLGSELLKEVFAQIESDYIAGWRNTSARDTDARERLWLAVQVLPALTGFARARDAVGHDMAHVLRSGGMSEDDVRAWKDALDASSSADQLKAAVGRGIELVNARLADLQARYRRGAHAPPELLSPKSKATLERLRQWSAPAAGER
jgi:hypothetical protein